VSAAKGDLRLLLDRLAAARITSETDPEAGHPEADQALIAYIGDQRVTRAFKAVGKWYA
jgi:hypothetical protein